ncbi:MAG: hypothetical protein ACLR2E_04785 [Lachnospiraceae bacterium]
MSLILSPDQQVLQGYQANRILAWLKPEEISGYCQTAGKFDHSHRIRTALRKRSGQ